MKNFHHSVLLFCSLFFLNHSVLIAQDLKQMPCENEQLKHQADSIKNDLAKDGFIVLRETSMQMESEYEMPIILPLNEGSWYEFVFIGDYTSKLYEVRMFDYEEKQVVYIRHQWGDVDGNVIRYSFIPQFSEYHMIKPVQVNKKKKMVCGYVMLLKKVR